MSASHDSSNWPEKLVLEEGQRVLLYNGDGSSQCPVVDYELAVSAVGESQLNKAFDLLFQEVMSIRKSKYLP